MGSKFDDWWNDHWKDLFSVPSKGSDLSKVKFPLTTTQPKTEAIRISWLVWLHRNTPADYKPRLSQVAGGTYYPKRGSNSLAIARKIIATEKRNTYLASLDPDDEFNENDDKAILGLVARYKRRAKKTNENVCQGKILKTVIFKIHNPSKRKRAMFVDSMTRCHLT